MNSMTSPFFAKLLIISGLFIGVSTMVASAQTAVSSFKAEECVITLGNTSCDSKVTVTTSPGRVLSLFTKNEEAIPVSERTNSLTYTGSSNSTTAGTFTTNSTGALVIAPGEYGKLNDYRQFGVGGGNRITYGVNTLTLTENGQTVGTVNVRAKCDTGLVWTLFTAPEAESRGACVATIPGAVMRNGIQIQAGKGVPNKAFDDADYGTVEGYCPVNQKWQKVTLTTNIVGGTTRTDIRYMCADNTDPVSAGQVNFSVSAALPSGYNEQNDGCSRSVPDTSTSNSCLGTITLTAPTGRTFTLRPDNGGIWAGQTPTIRELAHSDRRYGYENYINNATTAGLPPLVAPLSFNAVNTFELKLGSTTVSTVSLKATPSTTSTVCSGTIGVPCRTYTWTITSGTGTNTTTTTVNSTTPTTTTYPAGCTSFSGYSTVTGYLCSSNTGTTVTLPAGCTSTSGYSVSTGMKCDGTTTSNGTNTGTNTTTTTNTNTGSASPLNLSISQVSAELQGVVLRWSAPSTPLVRYKVSYVEYSTAGQAGEKTLHAYLIPSATDYVLSPLKSGVKYDMYVAAVDANGNDFSESVLRNVSLTSNTTTSTTGQQGDIDPNGTTGGMCLSLIADLRQGTRNDAVASLQDFLITANYLNAEATGYFGALTFRAVQNYQKDKGFTQSGFVGPLTRGAIQKDSCGS